VDAPAGIAAYYGGPRVRDRVAEYCAGSVGYAVYGGKRRRRESDCGPSPIARAALDQAFAEGVDVCRSLADRRGTILQLDVDYVSPLDPGAPYRDPATCFRRMEPVYRAVRSAFAAAGVPVIALMTGRGYHFTARAAAGSKLRGQLRERGGGTAPPRRAAPDARAASEQAAHAGAGRLIEALAHDVARSAVAEVPLTLADVPPPGLGPFICLDLSAYGDPVRSRYIRAAFSSHQKPLAAGIPGVPPFVIAIPRGELSLGELLAARRDPAAATLLAARAAARIPTIGRAPHWVRAYDEGVLSWFHRRFDEARRGGPAAAAARYAEIPPANLPLCVREALAGPHPRLLVPAALRTVTLALWSRGWHPAEIADLVRSRFEGDFAWGDLWRRYDPRTRADFYVRLFAGAVVAGLDGADAFNCHTQQERGACPGGHCGHELAGWFPGRDAFRKIGVAP